MSGISTGIGLISGINSRELIDQLIAIENRPVDALKTRMVGIDARRTAFLELSAKLLGLKSSITNFNKTSFFRRFSTTSTNDTVLTATAGESAVAGSATLRVHSLVSTHALVSRGFADSDRTSVGLGEITIESAQARVNKETELEILNGGAGVRRGVITISDRSGATADIDLRTALTVEDVLEAINSNARIGVRASVTSEPFSADGTIAKGDRIVLQDVSGGAGMLAVQDKSGGFAAQDLGIAASAASDRLDGRDIIRITEDTPLGLLNDGNGVGRLQRGTDLFFDTSYADFGVSLSDILDPTTDLRELNGGRGIRLGVIRVTDRTGKSAEIDLRPLGEQAGATAEDLRKTITDALTAAGVSATVNFVNSSYLVTDTTQTLPAEPKPLIVEDLSGNAAADLGIAGTHASGSIVGRAVHRVATVGDVLRAINFSKANEALVQASISDDGKGIALRALGFNNSVTVTAGEDGATASTAARDLGLEGATFRTNEPYTSRRLITGLNTVLLQSLRGGRGVESGVISFTDRAGVTAEIDFADAQTLQQIVDRINNDGRSGIRASINGSANGIELRDETGGTGALAVADVSGPLASQLGISGSFDATSVRGVNLQKQYVSRTTRLAELNGGRGVGAGNLRIVDSAGAVHTVNVARNLETVGQVIDEINAQAPTTLRARINDNGDGIILTDTSGGAGTLKIEEDGGRTATDLRLLGTAKTGQNFIDGSFEIRVSVGAGDTLRTLTDKINKSGADATAAIINDGRSFNPFSLTLTSKTSGRRGALIVDASGVGLELQTLSRARDAVVTIGGGDSPRPQLIASSTNQITGAIEGVTIDLLSAKDEDVTITLAQDQAAVIENIKAFVEKYNDALDTITDLTSFNSETFERGTLFGDATVLDIRSQLQRLVVQRYDGGDATVQRLFQIGVRLGQGNRLVFNESEFKAAYERAPQAVEGMFAKAETGLAAVLNDTLEGLTDDTDGAITRKNELLTDQRELLSRRIDGLNVLIGAKRTRLERQFAALETALAGLQDQQNALAALQQRLAT